MVRIEILDEEPPTGDVTCVLIDNTGEPITDEVPGTLDQSTGEVRLWRALTVLTSGTATEFVLFDLSKGEYLTGKLDARKVIVPGDSIDLSITVTMSP